MGSHPLNLAVRFLLEIAALVAAGMWGWRQTYTGWKFALAIGLPILLAITWGTFAVPEDPSRSGNAPVVTPGLIRLLIELAIFGFAAWALYDIGYGKFSLGLGIIAFLHYAVSYDRIIWLLSR